MSDSIVIVSAARTPIGGLLGDFSSLAAWELGIGSAPATVYDHKLSGKLLGLPADHDCSFIMSFGYPADLSALTAPNRAGGRRSLDEVAREEHW